jgi:hydroxymethylglutaryl-CoA synthase
MAQKAHHRHWEAELQRAVGMNDAALLSRINASFEQRVSRWLKLNAAVGNIYTGSLFLALIDYLRNVEGAQEGKTVSVFAYGSGCGASLLFARVSRGASAYRGLLDPQPDLDRRRRLDLAAYEELVGASESADANDGPALDPSAWRLGAGVYYLGTRDHMRQYGS